MYRGCNMATLTRNRQIRIVLLSALVLLVMATVGVLVYTRNTVPGSTEIGPDRVTFAVFFLDEAYYARLDRELDVFRSTYPQVAVELRSVSGRNMNTQLREGAAPADVVTVVNPAMFPPDTFHAPAVPWSGEFWGLYFRRSTLESVLGELPPQPNSFNELTTLFSELSDAGTRPLGIGVSHGWPLTALVQHVAGVLSQDGSGAAAARMASGDLQVDDEAFLEAVTMLREWRERGWITEDAPDQPWTYGVREVLAGDAAFAILNQQFLTAVPADLRSDIGFWRFPVEWAVGSVVHLARPSGRDDRPAVRALEGFLTSAGVVDRLERELARPFFGGVRAPTLPGTIIPSVTSDPNSAYHRNLWHTARSAIWDD